MASGIHLPEAISFSGWNSNAEELSPEQMQQVMQVWTEWIEGGMKAGRLGNDAPCACRPGVPSKMDS